MGLSARLLAADRRDPIDAPIKRRDDADPGSLRTRDQAGVGEVEPVDALTNAKLASTVVTT
jgi:hypothetical protein